MQKVVDDEGLEDVQLKMALHSARSNGGIVANDLRARRKTKLKGQYGANVQDAIYHD